MLKDFAVRSNLPLQMLAPIEAALYYPGCTIKTDTIKENRTMLSRPKLLAFVLVLFGLFVTLSVNAQTVSNANTDEAAIRDIVKQVQDGWNAHDAKAFAAPFAVDADYVVVNGRLVKGREAIEKGHTSIFSTIYKESHNVGTVKSVRFLRPEVAVAHVEWNLEFTVGGETRKARAMNTIVLTNDGGKWSIAAFHNTPVQSEGR